MAAGTTFLPAVVTIPDLPTGTTLTGGEVIEAVQTVAGLPMSVQLSLGNVVSSLGGLPTSNATGQFLQSLGTGMLATWVTVPTFQPTASLPVSGSTTVGLRVSSAGIGFYAGTGTPTFSASQGSLYTNAGGNGTTSRLFVNTNGSTGWTPLVTET